MITALIADDEPNMRESLQDKLLQLWPELNIIGQAEDGPSALAQIETLNPDIAFLDIRMPGLTGLQVAKSITTPTHIVFATAYEAHALEAFDANAVDYLVKPIEIDRLTKVISKLKRMVGNDKRPSLESMYAMLEKINAMTESSSLRSETVRNHTIDWLQVDTGNQIRMVNIQDVYYFESDSKYTRVVGEKCDGLIRTPIKELTEQLPSNDFIQIHRSTLVNRRYIFAVHRKGDVVELEVKGCQTRLKVSIANHHLFRAM